MPEINDTIRYVQPFLLDSVAVKLGPWSGYNVLAQHQNRLRVKLYFDELDYSASEKNTETTCLFISRILEIALFIGH